MVSLCAGGMFACCGLRIQRFPRRRGGRWVCAGSALTSSSSRHRNGACRWRRWLWVYPSRDPNPVERNPRSVDGRGRRSWRPECRPAHLVAIDFRVSDLRRLEQRASGRFTLDFAEDSDRPLLAYAWARPATGWRDVAPTAFRRFQSAGDEALPCCPARRGHRRSARPCRCRGRVAVPGEPGRTQQSHRSRNPGTSCTAWAIAQAVPALPAGSPTGIVRGACGTVAALALVGVGDISWLSGAGTWKAVLQGMSASKNFIAESVRPRRRARVVLADLGAPTPAT